MTPASDPNTAGCNASFQIVPGSKKTTLCSVGLQTGDRKSAEKKKPAEMELTITGGRCSAPELGYQLLEVNQAGSAGRVGTAFYPPLALPFG